MSLVSAVVEILDADAIDPGRGLVSPMPVQFNPAEYTLSKGAQFAEIAIPGIDSPILQFVRGQAETLKVDLLFDTTEFGMGESAVDVRTRTTGFYQLVKMQSKTHAPPRIRLIWGIGLSFTAIVESVEQKFTLFSPVGVPLRATLTVSLKEYKTLDQQLAELNLQSADHTKRRTVIEGDSLAGIAKAEYGDPRLWRLIADANKNVVPDPIRPPVGASLVIPKADQVMVGAVR